MKEIHVNVWFTWIKHHLGIHMFLDICKYMEDLLKVLLLWYHQVQGKHRRFHVDVNSAQFKNPSQNTNKIVEIRRIFHSKLRYDVNIGEVATSHQGHSLHRQTLPSIFGVFKDILNCRLDVLF